jgi:hypothetical protein
MRQTELFVFKILFVFRRNQLEKLRKSTALRIRVQSQPEIARVLNFMQIHSFQSKLIDIFIWVLHQSPKVVNLSRLQTHFRNYSLKSVQGLSVE